MRNNIFVYGIFELTLLHCNYYLKCETNEFEFNKWYTIFNNYIKNRSNATIKRSGYIIKQGNMNKRSWKKRYFVLFSNKLLKYYESSNEFKKDKTIYDQHNTQFGEYILYIYKYNIVFDILLYYIGYILEVFRLILLI